jgi:hypothetical protein
MCKLLQLVALLVGHQNKWWYLWPEGAQALHGWMAVLQA